MAVPPRSSAGLPERGLPGSPFAPREASPSAVRSGPRGAGCGPGLKERFAETPARPTGATLLSRKDPLQTVAYLP